MSLLTLRAMDEERSRETPAQADTTIRIRQYRYSDTQQIHELFNNSMASGDGSPPRAAMRAQLSSPLSLILYAISFLGLFSSARSQNVYNRYIGAALSFLALLTVCTRLYSLHSAFTKFIHHALRGDLANIASCYGMVPDIQKEIGKEEDHLVPTGKNCFWVAEACGEDGTSELVGYVGLDTNTNADDTSAELRRLVVSPKSRRRGVAGQLIRVAVAHARIHDIKSIYLLTSSYHTSAIGLYRKLGWVVRKRYVLFGSIHVTELNLDLFTSTDMCSL